VASGPCEPPPVGLLAFVLLDGRLDFGLERFQVEGSWVLHRRMERRKRSCRMPKPISACLTSPPTQMPERESGKALRMRPTQVALEVFRRNHAVPR
jgi:hypothetical protein